MVELSEKLSRHRENIPNSIRFQANSARSETVNTTIKVLIKMARGFRNIANIIALIYLKCSDLVIPLHNRPQMAAERAAAVRKSANELCKNLPVSLTYILFAECLTLRNNYEKTILCGLSLFVDPAFDPC